jgi:putative spermidine/putrescine transport system substrate-binding protein
MGVLVKHIPRRSFLRTASALALPAIMPAGARAQAPQLVIATYGGNFLQSMHTAVLDPFERETGIKVVVAGEPSVSRIKAMVDAGNVEWDVSEHSTGEMYILAGDNLLAKIDYSGFRKTELDQFDPAMVLPYGLGSLIFATAITYNSQALKPAQYPKSWADFFDPSRIPGKRVFYPMDRDAAPLEAALLADGVAPKDLYPLDLDRAFRALDRIKSSVLKWTGATVSANMVASGEAVMGAASSGRVLSMRAQGAPVDYSMNGALLYADCWVVPRGAKNLGAAMKYLEFVSRAETQARFAAIYPFGPTNRGAFKFLTADQAAQLPTAPAYADATVLVRTDWWAAADASGKINRDRISDRWRQWIVQ